MENWKDGEFTKEERNYQRKNIILRHILNRVERFILQLEDEEQEIADSKLRKRLTEIVSGEEKNEKTFLDCLDEFVSYKEKKGTIEIYNMTRRKIEYFDPRCTFNSIDKKWLMRFEDWLKDGGMRTNAIAIHLRNIRAVFNYAIDEEYTSNYPFRRFTIKKEETRKRSLTADQLRTLRDYHCEDYQIKYRDLFMLMFLSDRHQCYGLVSCPEKGHCRRSSGIQACQNRKTLLYPHSARSANHYRQICWQKRIFAGRNG